MPTSGEALPDPKARTLARGPRRYRRKVASPKQWQAIIAAKAGPCRACVYIRSNGFDVGTIQFHHVVLREDGGDDVADNIVPLHERCHRQMHLRMDFDGLGNPYALAMLATLTDAEYAYMVARGGEGYAERAYGVRYER